MKWSVGICDDISEHREILKRFCIQYASENNIDINFCLFSNGTDVLHYSNIIDILFLDICMNGISGIDMLPVLHHMNNIRQIIFVTCHTENVIDTFGLKTVGFMPKPIEADRLYHYLNMIRLKEHPDTILSLPAAHGSAKMNVSVSDIVYLQGANNYVTIHTISSPNGFLVYGSIGYWENTLRKHNFMRIHKSYIVNMLFVSSFTGSACTLHTYAPVLPVSRTYKSSASNMYHFFEASKR